MLDIGTYTIPELGHCKVGKHNIAYLAHNTELSGTPVIFVHGLSMSVHFWEVAMLQEVRDHCQWYSISLPLHYPSTYEGEDYEDAMQRGIYAETLGDTIYKLVGDEPVHLVGHSVGGFACLAYASEYPERCKGVMTIGGFITGRSKGLEEGLQLLLKGRAFSRAVLDAMWKMQQSSRWMFQRMVENYAADIEALRAYPPLEPTLDLEYQDISKHSLDAMYISTAWLINADITRWIHRITCPVWVIAGSEDPVVGYEHQRNYAALLPNAHLFTMIGAGHLSFAERPLEFNTLLLKFLGLTPESTQVMKRGPIEEIRAGGGAL